MDDDTQKLTLTHKINAIWILGIVVLFLCAAAFVGIGISVVMHLDLKSDIAAFRTEHREDYAGVRETLKAVTNGTSKNEDEIEALSERMEDAEMPPGG